MPTATIVPTPFCQVNATHLKIRVWRILEELDDILQRFETHNGKSVTVACSRVERTPHKVAELSDEVPVVGGGGGIRSVRVRV